MCLDKIRSVQEGLLKTRQRSVHLGNDPICQMAKYCFIDNLHVFKPCEVNPDNALPVRKGNPC